MTQPRYSSFHPVSQRYMVGLSSLFYGEGRRDGKYLVKKPRDIMHSQKGAQLCMCGEVLQFSEHICSVLRHFRASRASNKA